MGEQAHEGGTGGTGPGNDDLGRAQVPIRRLRRVDEPCKGDDGGGVLVVVHHGNRELVLQPPLDLVAAGCGNILQVDRGKGGGNRLHRRNHLFGILSVEHDRKRVDSGQRLKEQRLPFHHRQRALRPDVTQAQHGRPVGDDGHGAPGQRVLPHLVRMLGKVPGHRTDSRGIEQRQLLRRQLNLRRYFDLALELPMAVERLLVVVGRVAHRKPP